MTNQPDANALANAMRTAAYFDDRRAAIDWTAFDRLMARAGGEPPRDGDELPADLADRFGRGR